MSRPLRCDREGGWYHVTARGIDRREIVMDPRDHEHLLERVSEMVERFRVRVHAYVVMGNHYHLIVETPEANLSRAIQWLNVSYVVWFNRRHRRVGPLLQGRFKALVVEDAAWAYELSLYVHLNPVMRRSLGLDKRGKRVEGEGLRVPSQEEVTRRLRVLRSYRWSSYRAYAGYGKVPEWLTTGEILGRAGRERGRPVEQYRADVRERLTQGEEPERAEEWRDRFALGSEAFRVGVRRLAKGGREVATPRLLARRLAWEDIVKAVAEVTGDAAATLMQGRGRPGRPLVLWAARRFGGLTLRETGEAAGGMDYTAVAMAVKRLEQRVARDRQWHRLMRQVQEHCER